MGSARASRRSVDCCASWGAHVVDADELAREVVAPGTPGLAAVVAAFGADVLSADGALDRAALADLVFGDRGPAGRLEEIVHPLVHRRAAAVRLAPWRRCTPRGLRGAAPGAQPVREDPTVRASWTHPDDVRRQRLLAGVD